MRIIAGEFRGRRLRLPRDARVRPTTDRVREALFSILAPDLPGARVIDLFAGSGSLGLEALSRGASSVRFVERAKGVRAALQANVNQLGISDRTTVEAGDAMRTVATLGADAADIAFADPPYDTDFAARVVEIFRSSPFARILVVEHPTRTPIAGDDTRSYGDVSITFCYNA